MTPNWLRSLIRWGYVPFMFIVMNGLCLYVALASLSVEARLVYAILTIGGAICLSKIAERILPYNSAWNRSQQDTKRDLMHFLVNESISLAPSLVVPLFIATTISPIETSAWWPHDWAFGLQLLFAFLIFDVITNLVHWASHLWSPLWRLHAVHHEVKRMYGFNGILKHPLYQIISATAAVSPLYLLGAPKEFLLAISLCSVVQLLLQHSNVDMRTGFLKSVIATAEVHRFHHLTGRSGNVNFAMFFAFWDHIFGNAYYEKRHLHSEDIGLDYVSYPKSWHAQMLAPFRRWAIAEETKPANINTKP